MTKYEEKQLDRLYSMLEKTKSADNAAALRWAIFTLEQTLKEEGTK